MLANFIWFGVGVMTGLCVSLIIAVIHMEKMMDDDK